MKIAIVLSTLGAVVRAVSGSERSAVGLAQELTERGHEVWITNLLNRSVDWGEEFDILHCVNAGGPKGPYLGAIQTAKLLGIPTLTSTIYWPVAEQYREMAFYHNWDERKRAEQESVLPEWEKQTQLLFLESDMLLPNAELEMRAVEELVEKSRGLLTKYGGIPPYTVIPNAVDFESEIDPVLEGKVELPPELEEKLSERFVLCVGRIETRKNQIRLVEAMTRLWEEGEPAQLVLVGRVTPAYVENINWATLPILLHGEAEPSRVLELMRRCTVYAQPSLLETPGLATMEAAALGKPFVSGRNATEEEYFGDYAYYCDPTSDESIAKALKEALASPVTMNKEQSDHIRNNYSYKRAVDLLEEAYRAVIEIKSRGGE